MFAKLSKRAGNIIELRDLISWIGSDAVRYSLARYPADSPLSLDGEELRKQTNDNPVFYVQYAHARTANVARLAAAAGSVLPENISLEDLPSVRSRSANPIVRHASDAIRFYMQFHHTHGQGFIAHMHDPFAAAVAMDPNIATTRPATVDVELDGSPADIAALRTADLGI